MKADTVPISKFKATCLELFRRVKETGQPILVTKNGEPIGMVIPPPEPEKPDRWLGSFADAGEITGDIISPAVDEGEWQVLK